MQITRVTRHRCVASCCAATALLAVAAPAHAERAFALVNGTALVEFDTDTPASISPPRALSGMDAGETLVGLDMRPANGQLYGLGSSGRLYLIDGMSGRASAVGPAPLALSGTQFGFDFNPTVDRIRIVSDTGQNLRVNPDTGGLAATDGALTPGFLVTAAAYTNNFAGATTTTLFDLDATADQLLIQNPPNAGTLAAVGPLGVDISAAAGFDISATTGVAFVADVVGGASRLYVVDLTTGAATSAGTLGDGSVKVTGLAVVSRAVRLWGLTETNALISFSSGAPTASSTPVPVTGLQGGESLVGLDVRPATGALYGLGSTGRIYVVDRVTGLATVIGTSFGPLSGTAFGFDFNPTVDRIRVVSNTGQNLRLHPDTGAVAATDGALAPAGSVTAAAYTNNRAGATTTVLYDIDTATDQLVIQNPPNAGVLTVVGALGVDATEATGFDISSVDGTAFAALTVGGVPRLYTVNLATGAARLVGMVTTSLRGLAAEVPMNYAFAEGATGAFFTTEFAMANPTGLPAPVTAIFQRADGASLARTLTVGPYSRATLDASTVPGLAATAFGAVFTSADGVPLAVERTMRWDATGYGMHGERAVGGPALVWHFAEGSQGFFENYLLLSNPGGTPNSATVEFLVQGGPPVTRVVTLAPMSRLNVYGGEIPELANRAFGATVTFSAPGVAERAMYFGQPLFNGGSVAAGVQAPSTTWYHAEGATGPYFDTFLLLANPGTADATATVTYLLPAGGPVVRTYLVPSKQRITINVEQEDPLLANTAVGMSVGASQPLLSERAMYWPGSSAQWFESHASFGVTMLGQRWAFGEGRVGGPNNFATFVLLANPSNVDASSTVTFLRANGTTVQRTVTIPRQSRVNIWVNVDVPDLANESFGVSVVSTTPIFAERAMYSDAGTVQFAAGSVVTAARVP